MRECGLKPLFEVSREISEVTPHAGVWIETNAVGLLHLTKYVTPHAGVWIETTFKK